MTTENKKDTKNKKVAITDKNTKFTKDQIVKSEKYEDNRDILSAFLKDDNTYSINEADRVIEEYLKRDLKEKGGK